MRTWTTFLYMALPAVAWGIQLSPEIEADRYLVRAERKIEEQGFTGAKDSLDRILELQEQHDIEVPSEFSLMYMPGHRWGSDYTPKRSSPRRAI